MEKVKNERKEQAEKLNNTYRDVPTMLMDIEQNMRNDAITALNKQIATQENEEVKKQLEDILNEITSGEKGRGGRA